jgi:Protein of unknown function (DUF3078)
MLTRINHLSKALITLFLFASSFLAQAQIIKEDTLSNWKKTFRAGLNLNQASFSSNWKAGGVNSVGFSAYLNYKANYKKDIHSWDNEIDLAYGMVNNAGQGARKTLDRIFLDTKYGRAINAKWDLAASVNFQSQFANGYSYAKDAAGVEQETLISGLLSPAYVTAAVGFEYHPVDYFKLRLSPFSPRLTIVSDSKLFTPVPAAPPLETVYGVKRGETTRMQWLALQILAEFNKDIAKNVNLKWRYIAYADYENLGFDKIDHRLDLTLSAKVNNFVNVSFGGIVMYFSAQDKDVQISQALSLGLNYTFQNFKEKK